MTKICIKCEDKEYINDKTKKKKKRRRMYAYDEDEKWKKFSILNAPREYFTFMKCSLNPLAVISHRTM